MKPETIALHHGYAPDSQNAVAVPILRFRLITLSTPPTCLT